VRPSTAEIGSLWQRCRRRFGIQRVLQIQSGRALGTSTITATLLFDYLSTLALFAPLGLHRRTWRRRPVRALPPRHADL
jgi:hypothetical protein